MIGLIISGFLIVQTSKGLPDAESITGMELRIPLRVYSSEGLLISEFGNERRKPVSIETVPKQLIDAVLAIEDDGFFEHNGIDIKGLIRAAISNFKSGQTQQGASTITMQVARNFFLSREKTYIRKLREVLLAIKLEQILSKDEILSLYLNKIFLGYRSYGFGAAADVYYNKELEELSLAETAMLAGLPKAPSSNNPVRNPQKALLRRNYVLSRLLELEKISTLEHEQATAAPISAQRHTRKTEIAAPHIAEMVRSQLIDEFGEGVYWQGLNVFTTIQATQQNAAIQALRKGIKQYDRRHGFRGPIAHLDLDKADLEITELLADWPSSMEQIPALILSVEQSTVIAITAESSEISLSLDDAKWAKKYISANRISGPIKNFDELVSPGDIVYVEAIQDENEGEELSWKLSQLPAVSGALISMHPTTGQILSLVGGYDFFLNKYNRAIQSIRQPGSNIKPFIYSASLDQGFTPATLISGAPIVITDQTHGTVWRPENYSGEFFGPTRMREALSKSMNLVSVRLLRSIGVPYARQYAERFGIDMSRFSPTLTMALGSGGMTPLDMLSAYSVLANTGYKIEPYFIDHITNRHGEVVYRAKQPILCDECYQEYLPKPEVLESEIPDNSAEQPDDLEQESEEEPTETYLAPRVMGRGNNYLTVSMLKDVIRRGTARKALALNRTDLAGKTGTTNDYIDAWFTGFNSQVATTVWLGFDEPTTMGRGEAGSKAALPIWVDYMKTALASVEQDTEAVPDFIQAGFVNRSTGQETNEEDPMATAEYFIIESKLPELERAPGTEPELTDELLLEGELGEDLDQDPATHHSAPSEERIIETEQDTEGLF